MRSPIELQKLRQAIGWTNGRPILMTGFSISNTVRDMIVARIIEIESCFSATIGRADAARAVRAMLAGFPSWARDDPDLAADAYLSILVGVPSSMVVELVRQVLCGAVPTLTKSRAPSTAEFRALLDGMLRPLERELAELSDLLIAADNDEQPIERDQGSFERIDHLAAELRVGLPGRGRSPR